MPEVFTKSSINHTRNIRPRANNFNFARMPREFNESKWLPPLFITAAEKDENGYEITKPGEASSRLPLKIYDDITGLFIHLTSSGRQMS